MMPSWKYVAELSKQMDCSGRHDLPEGSATILSDRVASALSMDGREGLEEAQAALECFYLQRLSSAPRGAAAAARGDEDVEPEETAAFNLGLIGFAHAVVARAASRRVDDEFERRILSRQFERYVRLLIDDELSGRDIAERLGKDDAEVSRRLAVLRRMGAVECRREGNRIVNFLTPAARVIAKARNMGSVGQGSRTFKLSSEVRSALDVHRRMLPPSLRSPQILVAAGDRRSA